MSEVGCGAGGDGSARARGHREELWWQGLKGQPLLPLPSDNRTVMQPEVVVKV